MREPSLPLRLRNATRPVFPTPIAVAADGSFVASIDGFLIDVLRFDRGEIDGRVLLHVLTTGDGGVRPVPAPADGDRDGWAVALDCNDADPRAFPGAPELCDGLDNDCDGFFDESPFCSGTPCAMDRDCPDPFNCDGTVICAARLCVAGVTPDCDDGNPATTDWCDPSPDTCVHSTGSFPVCGNGLLEAGEACDDGNREGGDSCPSDCGGSCVASTEICNGLDDDCDGVADNGLSCPTACSSDADCGDDGLFCTSVSCLAGSCVVGPRLSCDDGDPATVDDCDEASDTCSHGTCVPTAEICDNRLDDDCDGMVDEAGCTCPTGRTMGGTVCVDLLFDEPNCRAGGIACSAGRSGEAGSCTA